MPMIGRGYLSTKPLEQEEGEARGFDAFELRLGDLMRGERATMGKSLLDVQRELKIKAAYIAAIENADPSAFDTPGFIAGYVRSYARYLNMDPDWAFETFCRESGFVPTHGMAAAPVAPARRRRDEKAPGPGLGRDIFAGRPAPYIAQDDGFLANLEPRAVGSILVLVALLAGLSYAGWFVLREVQKVTFAPVEQPPTVVADLDPLAGGAQPQDPAEDALVSLLQPSAEALDRLYRPEALEVPVLVPRDGPIAALDPATVGTLAAGGGSPSAGGPGNWSAPAQVGDAAAAAGPSSPALASAQGTGGGDCGRRRGDLGQPSRRGARGNRRFRLRSDGSAGHGRSGTAGPARGSARSLGAGAGARWLDPVRGDPGPRRHFRCPCLRGTPDDARGRIRRSLHGGEWGSLRSRGTGRSGDEQRAPLGRSHPGQLPAGRSVREPASGRVCGPGLGNPDGAGRSPRRSAGTRHGNRQSCAALRMTAGARLQRRECRTS